MEDHEKGKSGFELLLGHEVFHTNRLCQEPPAYAVLLLVTICNLSPGFISPVVFTVPEGFINRVKIPLLLRSIYPVGIIRVRTRTPVRVVSVSVPERVPIHGPVRVIIPRRVAIPKRLIIPDRRIPIGVITVIIISFCLSKNFNQTEIVRVG